ncbi:hypothetical protein C7H09_06855 [Marinobacter fuscus]|uniref:Uncharacterized protein n=1 Tax=Marinobacter fuscus TaxID=2109942 RepID=A0A2T1KKP5_9GAMM|nr:hypothetical protein [Marinobacter fuscus]PSF10655.1 hypothetical protein C7H09_06855 [Marinobacter fuscus]
MRASSRIELALRPSVIAGVLASLPWLMFALALVAGALELTALLLFLAPAALYFGVADFRRCGLLQGKHALLGLSMENGQLYGRFANGHQLPLSLLRCTSISASAVTLKVRAKGLRLNNLTAILLGRNGRFGGNVTEQEFRRFRMWLIAGPRA